MARFPLTMQRQTCDFLNRNPISSFISMPTVQEDSFFPSKESGCQTNRQLLWIKVTILQWFNLLVALVTHVKQSNTTAQRDNLIALDLWSVGLWREEYEFIGCIILQWGQSHSGMQAAPQLLLSIFLLFTCSVSGLHIQTRSHIHVNILWLLEFLMWKQFINANASIQCFDWERMKIRRVRGLMTTSDVGCAWGIFRFFTNVIILD